MRLTKLLLTASFATSVFAASPAFNVSVSASNTILQNLQALAMSNMNTSVSYINLLLGMNTSCTSEVAQLLNSSEAMNLTFFAPSDSAFSNITGWPDLGANFCNNCNNTSSSGLNTGNSSSSTGSSSGACNNSSSSCAQGCNSTAVGFNATASELSPCLSEVLQYHVLNESLYFNETRFGFLNRSSTNVTVLPTYLNSSCLVHLSNTTNNTSGGQSQSSNQTQSNNQYLVFNITNTNSSSSSGSGQGQSSSNMTSPYNVTILHGINTPANVTSFDIQSSNGVLHIIDAVLIPPANFSQTLNYTYNMTQSQSNSSNSTGSSSGGSSNNSSLLFLNQTDLSMLANMTGITVLLPDPEGMQQSGNSSNNSFNVTDYVFPQVIFNNQSFVNIGNLTDGVFLQQNFTNINGQNVTFLFGRNYSVIVNGTQITKSNILMDNGVLHLLNSTQLSSHSQNQSQDQSQPILTRLLRFFKS